MGVKERQTEEDIERARIWIENLLEEIGSNYLVIGSDYLTPTVDKDIVLRLSSPQGLYEHFKGICEDLIETRRGSS